MRTLRCVFCGGPATQNECALCLDLGGSGIFFYHEQTSYFRAALSGVRATGLAGLPALYAALHATERHYPYLREGVRVWRAAHALSRGPTLKWEPRDLWVGLFWDRRADGLHVYLCLLPTLVIHWVKR